MSEQNHKLFRSIFWSSFRNNKTVCNVMRKKTQADPLYVCNFVASTLRSLSRESLRNLGQCGRCMRGKVFIFKKSEGPKKLINF